MTNFTWWQYIKFILNDSDNTEQSVTFFWHMIILFLNKNI